MKTKSKIKDIKIGRKREWGSCILVAIVTENPEEEVIADHILHNPICIQLQP